MKFRKKPVVIEATQWFKNGDHSVVRASLHPEFNFNTKCNICKGNIQVHGWIDTLEGGYRVCPKDWIITGIKGENYPCKPDIFDATYEPVE